MQNEKLKAYTNLLNDYSIFLEKWSEEDKKVASRFNLFSILKIDWKETLFHTPFLSELLNPKGTHSQGALFYKEFINVIFSKKDQSVFKNIRPGNLYIKNEHWIKNGQIDIFIHHKDKENPFVIIIENKIYSGDQYEQLKKYYDFANNIFNISKDRIRLVYLTLDGTEPSDSSLEKEVKAQLLKDQILIPISYKGHIRDWMKTCESLDNLAPVVRYSIKQYLLTLQTLCNE